MACHFAFSWIGFNPTDEGWLQAIARRMIEGQVPHRDFISIRPVLSALLQIPVVWLGGDHVLWWARLWGWLEIGGIAWLWSGILVPGLATERMRAAAFGIILVLTAHVFPIMAWHTLDGMLLCSWAVALAQRGTTTAWRGAFVVAGLSCLTRQNFVFFLPFLALGLPRWQTWTVVLWSGVTPLVYLLWIAALRGAPDFFQQILATRGALSGALQTPLHTPAFYWSLGLGLAGTLAWTTALRWARPPTRDWIEATLHVATGGYAVYYLSRSDCLVGGYVIFGLVIIVTAFAIVRGRLDAAARLPVFCTLGLGWTVSISTGYSSPALMAGVLLITLWHVLAQLGKRDLFYSPATQFTGAIICAVLLVALSLARTSFPYEDKPVPELTRDAGEVLAGAAGLRTNETTYAALRELQTITRKLELQKRPYVIFTDYSAFWIKSAMVNPLNCEWPQTVELGLDNKVLVERLAANLARLSPQTVVIVHRHITARLAEEPVEVSPQSAFYGIQVQLVAQLRPLSDGQFFRTYALPGARP